MHVFADAPWRSCGCAVGTYLCLFFTVQAHYKQNMDVRTPVWELARTLHVCDSGTKNRDQARCTSFNQAQCRSVVMIAQARDIFQIVCLLAYGDNRVLLRVFYMPLCLVMGCLCKNIGQKRDMRSIFSRVGS